MILNVGDRWIKTSDDNSQFIACYEWVGDQWILLPDQDAERATWEATHP